MLELNINQNNNSYSNAYGKEFARVEYKKAMDIDDMAAHMAEHNTPFSKGTIAGILKDFVACTREVCLDGHTVKIDNLAIFKCSIQANGLLLGENYKIFAGLGGLPATKNADGTNRTPDYTKEGQYAVKSVKLLAQATGDFTRQELNGDATFRWTKAAKNTIDSIVNPTSGSGSSNNSGNSGGGSNSGGSSNGGDDEELPGPGGNG